MLDGDTGEISIHTLKHEDGTVRAFYQALPMSAEQRKAISERMTKYWAARRAGKKR